MEDEMAKANRTTKRNRKNRLWKRNEENLRVYRKLLKEVVVFFREGDSAKADKKIAEAKEMEAHIRKTGYVSPAFGVSL